jgi:transcriptional regulator with XRE-family HTH domain
MSIGSRIRQAREEAGLSRADLSKLSGITASAIANYELDISVPNTERICRIMEALDVDPNFMYQDYFKKKDPALDIENGIQDGPITPAIWRVVQQISTLPPEMQDWCVKCFESLLQLQNELPTQKTPGEADSNS